MRSNYGRRCTRSGQGSSSYEYKPLAKGMIGILIIEPLEDTSTKKSIFSVPKSMPLVILDHEPDTAKPNTIQSYVSQYKPV